MKLDELMHSINESLDSSFGGEVTLFTDEVITLLNYIKASRELVEAVESANDSMTGEIGGKRWNIQRKSWEPVDNALANIKNLEG